MAKKKGTSARKATNAKAGKRKVYGKPIYDANGNQMNARKGKSFGQGDGYIMDSMR